MSEVTIVFTIIIAALALFIWNRVSAVIVGIGVSLALLFTGILSGNEAVAGFGDPTVVLIAGLFVVGAGLEAAGVTTWAGQLLVERAGESRARLMILMFLMAAIFTATISVNGTVAALLPVGVVVALRMGMPTSQLLLPLCFSAHSAVMLTLIGAPLNILGSNAAREAGYGAIGFFEFAVAGIPMLLGSWVIMILTQRFLLPHRSGNSLPADFSQHARTLVEQYRIEDGVHRLRVRPSSPYIGAPRGEVDLKDHPDLSLVAIEEGEQGKPLQRPALAEGDVLLVRGEADAAGRFAADKHLAFRSEEGAGSVTETLFNRGSGLAEVMVPPRSRLVGQTVFPGMSTPDGGLLIVAVQRGGQDLEATPVTLAVGDHMLMQGTWQALDSKLADPQYLVVDSPEVVRRQAVPLGHRAWEAMIILAVLVVLLVTGWVPAAVAAVICSVALVLFGVLTLPQAYRGIDWNTCFLIGGMLPLATAMTRTGTADVIAHGMVSVVGDLGPPAVVAGIFIVTAALTQVMSNTAAALVMLPIAVATGPEVGISSMPLIIATMMGAHAALLTPVATPVNMMVLGPGGYQFGEYWKFGLPMLLWWLVVAVFIVPLYWKF
jgi:di/tricarboxylate transporter